MTFSSKIKNKIYIIAEIGVNHNGKLSLAKQLIDEAIQSGADAVKFQIFKTNNLVTKTAKLALYQKKNIKNIKNQFQMLRKLELKLKDFENLKNYCKKKKIDFINSVFDEESFEFNKKILKSKIIKIASGEIDNIFLLRKLNIKKEKIILSTGMSTYKDIVNSLNYLCKKKVFNFKNNKIKIINKRLFQILKKNLVLMHCVTDYPVKDEFANLSCIDKMIKDFKLNIGYSDHTIGNIAPLIAASKGAKVIEKHFTLNKKFNGPDHKSSLEPIELLQMVKSIRKFELLNGNGIKKLEKCEISNIKIAKKSLVAKTLINKNEKFSFDNVTVKRPASGLSPLVFEKILNKKSRKKYLPDEIIKI
tara:strand:+ start:3708 stop:4790 length:1083 start_codon:yes stop_codon:yes gene_type:complete